jgi:citrate synthase
MANTVTNQSAKLELGDTSLELPIIVGTENEHAIDIRKLRGQTGYITLDEGYRNTGSCQSSITFIDGEEGILRYRGIPIEQLAANCDFIETAWLVIHGELPTQEQQNRFRQLFTHHEMLHEGLRNAFDGFPATGDPMAILSAMINAVSCYHPDVIDTPDDETFVEASARLLSKVRTIAAASYKTSVGEPIMYPDPKLGYCENFLHMMFSKPNQRHEPHPEVVHALNLILLLHADHEQNCSTSTVRMVGSSGANLFASCAAGVCALWGPLHGGANVRVINQLNEIHHSAMSAKQFIEHVKNSEERLYGFGHAVYKNMDPRARILKDQAAKVMDAMHYHDPLLDIARELENAAMNDSYFTERKLFPNVDFYSGIIMRAIGIPINMFTVMFAIGRMPGWIANYKEVQDTEKRIYRPRQVYVGPAKRDLTPAHQR